jgi:hypothetical protein
MAEGPLDARALPSRERSIALLLVIAALLCAAMGQHSFGLADASQNIQYDVAPAQRNAALAWYATASVVVIVLCRRTQRWRLPAWPRSRRWQLCLVALVCMAAWLRFHRLAELPPGLWVDEALNGVQAVQIAARGEPLVALPPEDVRTGLGAGFVDVAAVAFRLFDPSDGRYALRAVAAVIGTAGVGALAALAWLLYGTRAAVVATSWLAVSQWHLNYSRWGEMPIMSPLIETSIVLGIALALRARGWRSALGFLAAGMLAGAGVYTYQTFRLFIALTAPAAAGLALWRARVAVAHWHAIAVALLLALLVAAPMLRYAAAHPREFGERARDTLIFGRDDWRQQLAESVPRSLLAFQLIGDDNPRHNLPFLPLLSFIPAMLAPLGLAICFSRWRQGRYAMLPVWLGIALVPGAITLEAPHASRLLDAIIPLALLIGVAADWLFGMLQTVLPRRFGWLVAALALTAALLTVTAEYRAYFVERERRPEFVDAFAPWESAPGRYLAAHSPNATVFLDPITYASAATLFMARRYLETLPNDVRMLRLQHDFPPAEQILGEALYLLPRPYAPLAPVIRALWPEARCEEERDAFERINLAACRVPAGAIEARRAQVGKPSANWPYGLRGRFYDDANGGVPSAEATLAFPYLEYSLDEPPLGAFRRAEWDGFIDIPRPGEYLFRLHPDSSTLTINDRLVIESAGDRASGGGHDARVELQAGRLPLRITLDPGQAGRYFLWFVWQPPGQEVEIVPAAVLHPPG